ncbi:hypothetical protein NM688_g5201 [Phlebia brevispora]|uniref:Uncharacterized protein n=1 Tax=Phlebia brevispora TaxID=194682 RepID=A0ACC1SZ77_9APHY|nr:hypothetical protein NM688_g5201 [Phlebia brevispora]
MSSDFTRQCRQIAGSTESGTLTAPNSHESSPAPSTADALPSTTPATTAMELPLDNRATKKASFERRYRTAERSNKDILQDQRNSWTSKVYDHFQPPNIIVDDRSGEVKYQFICKAHPYVLFNPVTHVRWDDSTSNFKCHIDCCEGRLAALSAHIEEFAHGTVYSKGQLHYLLALWCASRHRPYLIIEDPELLAIFCMLYAKVEVPSAITLSRDICEIFNIACSHLATKLKAYEGHVHVCLDGWTAPNVISFLGVTFHQVVDGKIQSIILDFIKLTKGHTREYLSEKLERCLRDYNIDKKLLAVTTDNASNNDTLIRELGDLGGMNSTLTHVCCFAHVWNLAVKVSASSKHKAARSSDSDLDDSEVEDGNEDTLLDALLAELDEDEEEGAAEAAAEENELDADREAADNDTIEDVVAEIDAEDELSMEEKRLGRFAVSKLSGLAKQIFHSPTLRSDLTAIQTKHELPQKQMLRAVATHWNSLAEAIGRALELRGALDWLLAQAKHDKGGKKGLRCYKLSNEKWKLLEQLFQLLKAFLQATEHISKSSKAATNLHLLHPVRSAAARGHCMLNKYYSKMNDSIMYHCAMMLHLSYKLEYFRQHEWLPEWIRTAEDILRDQWAIYYKPDDVNWSTTEVATTTTTSDNLFAEVDSWGKSKTCNSVGDYLKTDIVVCADPLAYWIGLLGRDPLAQMALDFLSAPAAFVEVECTFSRGGLTVSKRRHMLSDESICTSTVLGS